MQLQAYCCMHFCIVKFSIGNGEMKSGIADPESKTHYFHNAFCTTKRKYYGKL